jgi:hypothetical protein
VKVYVPDTAIPQTLSKTTSATKKLKVYVLDTAMRQILWCLLGMQAGSMTPKAPSITPRINLRPNLGDAGLKTDADGTSDINKHDELHIH